MAGRIRARDASHGIPPLHSSASERGDGLREPARLPPRGETLFGAGELTLPLRPSGLPPLDGGVLRGEGLLRGLGLRRAGDALP